MLVNGNVN